MPLYEYRCRDCDRLVERVAAMAEADTPGTCPECGGGLRRVWGRVAVRFRGWGFSKTDGLLGEDRRAKRSFDDVSRRAEEIRDSD